MRKLKLQVQISVDGYIAGPKSEMDWMMWDWDDGLKNYVVQLTEPVDTIVLGRKLADGFIPHWANVTKNQESPDLAFAKIMHEREKIVFTSTVTKADWHNTKLVNGDLKTEITKLKKQAGKDIIVYGGASFVSALIKEGLIDELYLFVNPTAIGSGMTIFKERTNLKFIEATSFDCGIVVLHYRPSK